MRDDPDFPDSDGGPGLILAIASCLAIEAALICAILITAWYVWPADPVEAPRPAPSTQPVPLNTFLGLRMGGGPRL